MDIDKLIKGLEAKIQSAYTEGVSLEDAEKLAGEFLHAQIQIADALKLADLDARMRKSGVKAVRATIYMQEATKTEKKPSDQWIENAINLNKLACAEQDDFDKSETERQALERYYDICLNAHIFFRGVARGKFD